MRWLTVLSLLAVTGCSSVLPGYPAYRPLCPGTRSYDPQICRGESWQQIPNFTNEAIIRKNRGETW
jgi:hypothetical protein